MIHLICGSTGAGKTTYANELRQRLGALHLSIDDWMMTLFAPDTPPQVSWPWIEARVMRCEQQIVATALDLARTGVPSVLDLGFQQIDQRKRVAERATAAGVGTRLHFLDIDVTERWRRVEARNDQQGETFRMKVPRPMFEFIETIWQPPTPEEMSAFGGVRVAD